MKVASSLEGHGVALEPLADRHVDELVGVMDDEIWRYAPIAPGPLPSTRAEHRAWLARWYEKARAAADAGTEIPYGVRRLGDRALVGSTRCLNVDGANRRLEIGFTFYGAGARATSVNAACKRLLLGHAFDELSCIRVELKCDARNMRSRAAILRLGAVEEGIFRRHRILGDGFIRDTVYFSIVDREWPAVRARLDARLERTPRPV